MVDAPADERVRRFLDTLATAIARAVVRELEERGDLAPNKNAARRLVGHDASGVEVNDENMQHG